MNSGHPITIANCNNIAIFGVTSLDNIQPMLKPAAKYRVASYIKEDVIGTIFNCNNCVISGFSFKTWISSKNKNTDKLFNVSGKNTAIHFNNLIIRKNYLSRYFDINGVNSVKISNVAINYREHKDNQVASPAINVTNTNLTDINHLSIINFDPYLNDGDAGLITLVNPVRFKIRNTTFQGSRFSADAGYGSKMIPIYVRFNDFIKYKHLPVYGSFSNISMTRYDGWPSHWGGITLDGQSESLASLLGGQYKNILGTVTLRNTLLPNSGGKVRKKFLPNLWVDDGTSLSSTAKTSTTGTSSTPTTETVTIKTDAMLSKTTLMPTETLVATTPVKPFPTLSTNRQTTTPALTTSMTRMTRMTSKPLPTSSRVSQTGVPFTDNKIKPSRAAPDVSVQSTLRNINSTRSETENSSVSSTGAILGGSIGSVILVTAVTIVATLYCRQKRKANPGEAGLQMMPK
ncbi:hypothetical protein NX722_18505 [Endozoicomonas gorgoniicola]|uniref:Right handed beta helix domain-containing protein n=1 Tax=Endozoicomonas gorgoniicola TaxID=1234144 RepID=A0ABT3MYY4_9GAMM|nr:hypothetical protein [Endozoicomonas gorgoniicola]MCW7554572.1 hypothetical protein [Endozoicomonas gorgoniicola]